MGEAVLKLEEKAWVTDVEGGGKIQRREHSWRPHSQARGCDQNENPSDKLSITSASFRRMAKT